MISKVDRETIMTSQIVFEERKIVEKLTTIDDMLDFSLKMQSFISCTVESIKIHVDNWY